MKVSQVRFPGSDENENGEDYETFISLAALPSMRTMFGDSVEGRYEYMTQWNFLTHTSNVTEIMLPHSAVKAEYVTQLLVGIKALKRFTYDHNEDLRWVRGMKAHKIIGALLEHTKHSLE
ncbi:MAG: hypothetical protein Q9175_007509 [Cornicularia normoerica]